MSSVPARNVVEDEPKRRSIAYFANGIGNFILAMPAMQAVASMDERGVIDLMMPSGWSDQRKPIVREIAEAWPVVGRVFDGDSLRGFRPDDYGLWFYSTHNSRHDSLTMFRDRAAHFPVGRPAWGQSLVHEADHYMDIAYAMGYEGPAPRVEFPVAEVAPHIPLGVGGTPVLVDPGSSQGGSRGGSGPVVGLCNGSFGVDYWLKKRWPHFARLAGTLRLGLGATVVGVGGDGELGGVPLDVDFTGKTSFLETAAVVARLDVLVTTDTSCMHLANVLGVPLVALFGPTHVSKNAPRGRRSIVLRSRMDCAPCQDSHRFYRCSVNSCMPAISVGDVVREVRNQLESIGRRPGNVDKP